MTFIPTEFGDDLFGDFLFGGMFAGEAGMVAALPGYEWQILVRDINRQIVGPLEVTSLELHPKHLALGSWIATYADATSDAGAALLLPGAGLVVAVNNVPVMSGPAMKTQQGRDGDTRTYVVGGSDDFQFIADRVAHPQPGTSAPPYNTQPQDVRGPAAAETVIKQFLNVNAASGALAARRVAGLVIEADLGRGGSLKGAGSWQQLSDLALQLALAGGLGIRVVQLADGTLQVQIYEPADKTATAIFSVELGNAQGYGYAGQRPTANYIYGLGSGTGTLRTVKEGSDSGSIADWGRIEGVLDQGSTADAAVMNAAIDAELTTKSSQWSVTVAALDTGALQWAPVATDASVETYDLGDLVGVVIDGVKISEAVTEVGVLFNADGTRIVPVIGTPNAASPGIGLVRTLVRHIEQLQAADREQQRRVS